jgi:RimJ/RimL family protein N-acetyltransferase
LGGEHNIREDGPVEPVEIVENRLLLRPWRAEDAEAVHRACQDPDIRRWTTVPDPYQRSDAEYFVNDVGTGAWARGTGALFAIADPDDAYAGAMGLRLSPVDRLAGDVGFNVAPHARARGYCTAALAAVCAWAFATLHLARIEWRAHVGNEASKRVAEKAGFTIEGVQRAGVAHRGERRDAWVGALLADDVKEA